MLMFRMIIFRSVINVSFIHFLKVWFQQLVLEMNDCAYRFTVVSNNSAAMIIVKTRI